MYQVTFASQTHLELLGDLKVPNRDTITNSKFIQLNFSLPIPASFIPAVAPFSVQFISCVCSASNGGRLMIAGGPADEYYSSTV
jgi:hypothetical protein